MSQVVKEVHQSKMPKPVITDLQIADVLTKMKLDASKLSLPAFTLDEIGRFGLKTEVAVRAALNSPKIKAEIAKYANELAITEQLLEESLFQMMLKQILKWLLNQAKKAAKKDKDHLKELNAAYQHHIDDLKAKREKKAKDAALDAKKTPEGYLVALENIEKEIQILEEKIAENNKKIASLEEELQGVEIRLAQATVKFAMYEAGLAETVQDLSHPDASHRVEQMFIDFTQRIEKHSEKMSKLVTDPSTNPDKKTKLQYKIETLHLQKSHTQDFVDVIKGNKFAYGHNFQPVAFQDAIFILDREIAYDEQNRPIYTNRNSQHMSLEEKEDAHQLLKTLMPFLYSLPHRITVQKNEETKPLIMQKEVLSETLEQEKSFGKQLQQQLGKKQNEEAKMVAKALRNSPLLQLANSRDSTGKMFIQFNEAGFNPRLEPKTKAQLLKEELADLRKTGAIPPSPERLMQLITLLPESERNGANQLASSLAKQRSISPNQWAELLKKLEAMASPAASVLKTPSNTPKPEAASPTALTPFPMKPVN